MSFGSNLERFRKSKKISQSALGTSIGITQQMISSYEKDLSSPNIDVLIKLSDFFNVSIDTLVGHHAKTSDFHSSTSRFLTYFTGLTELDREKCILIIQTILTDRNLKLDKKRKRSQPL
ncbi:helix-turn-helix domain-containing protein [Anaeromicropila herbilytica]|uniref:Transcriptional regulator n=1 Tax=Anaeromicropila herbilytica TaxID=2785025 RepID=A0A7R7EPQ7_9FIRM|nr:helix-turn-helix transcriptional regulator [Anaeromicropila herbilytica]BCN32800.1 transcriptional regulator [Anaeromicropila herbilytica]